MKLSSEEEDKIKEDDKKIRRRRTLEVILDMAWAFLDTLLERIKHTCSISDALKASYGNVSGATV